MKKIIIIIIAIILVSLTILGILYSRNKTLTKDEFIELMLKMDEITNIKIEDSYSTKYIKDDLLFTRREDNLCVWVNFSAKETIWYNTELKQYYDLGHNENKGYTGLEDWDYTFLRYERYNGVRCAVGEFRNKEMNYTAIYWVNAHNGVILKNVNNGFNSEGKSFETITEYKVFYNVVTDEDVARPNLEGYDELLPYEDEGGEVIITDEKFIM